jgi:uncharacterized membrane protein YphA (DoxX/SURF4 family)
LPVQTNNAHTDAETTSRVITRNAITRCPPPQHTDRNGLPGDDTSGSGRQVHEHTDQYATGQYGPTQFSPAHYSPDQHGSDRFGPARTSTGTARVQPPSAPVSHRLGHASTAGMLIPLRIFLAAGWARAGIEKVIDPDWWGGAGLKSFLVAQHHEALPFFRPVTEHVLWPMAAPVAWFVLLAQLACGVLIALGRKLHLALGLAFLMNITFILAGRVNPSAFYLVMQLVLVFAIADGALGERPTIPSHRTFAIAGLAGLLAGTVILFARTIQPGKVIDDPAMMLSFLGAVVALTLVVRRAAHPHHESSRLGRMWSGPLGRCVHAKAAAKSAESPTATK